MFMTRQGCLDPGCPRALLRLSACRPIRRQPTPRTIYDWINRRYILAFIQFSRDFSTPSSYWIAVSQGDNPAGGYCLYNLGVQSVGASGGVFPLPDFPRLGQDRQAIYLASNIFNPSFKWEEVLVLPKAQMYACQGFGFSFFFNLNLGGVSTDTTQPANVTNIGDDPRSEYLVTSENILFGNGQCSSGCNGLVVWAINSPLSGPTLTGTFVGTGNNYSLPPNATQPSSPNSIDTGTLGSPGWLCTQEGRSMRLLTPMGAPGSLLSSSTKFARSSMPPTAKLPRRQSSTRIPHILGDAQSFYYATQQPDPEGNVTTVFNFSDSGDFAGLAYVRAALRSRWARCQITASSRGRERLCQPGPVGRLYRRRTSRAERQQSLSVDVVCRNVCPQRRHVGHTNR